MKSVFFIMSVLVVTLSAYSVFPVDSGESHAGSVVESCAEFDEKEHESPTLTEVDHIFVCSRNEFANDAQIGSSDPSYTGQVFRPPIQA